MNIRDLQKDAHSLALDKGWWPYPSGADGKLRIPNDSIAAKLCLVHSETSEALECVRDGDLEPYWSALVGDYPGPVAEGPKPEGLPSELADIVIRVADLAGALGIDLQAAIKDKMEYNTTRTHRHGGRNL